MSHSTKGFRLPQQRTIEDSFKFLLWNQFPRILEKSVSWFGTLVRAGTYNKHVRADIKSFMEALHDVNSRQIQLSGIGSLIDFDTYGHELKRPSPQLAGTGCEANSLCLSPKCFNFVEGVIESNNIVRNLCWSLEMPCLKDLYYSDTHFDKKMKHYFAAFFAQPPGALTAFIRTHLIRNSIKVVASNTPIFYTGSLFGGGDAIPLPFYIDPVEPTEFPLLASIPGGVGGLNLEAFAQYLAPRLFSGAFEGGLEDVAIYGLQSDWDVAKYQTSTVLDRYTDVQTLKILATLGKGIGTDQIECMFGNSFTPDELLPTIGVTGGQLLPVPADILEPSTIAGFQHTTNPQHRLQKYRALLFIPSNWQYSLVEPPRDNFSDLGLDGSLNFLTNTPGAQVLMSSSLFARNQIGPDGTVYIGDGVDAHGFMCKKATGVTPRQLPLKEAIRTELFVTHSHLECTAAEGQLPNAGARQDVPTFADGFLMRSLLTVATSIRGQAKPVLLIFRTDEPRSAQPVVVCDKHEVAVEAVAGNPIVSCCPGNQNYAVLTFRSAVGDEWTVEDTAIYRTGAKGKSFLVTVTAVSGNVVTIQAQDEDTILPCCTGSPDDYGTRGELIKCSEVETLCSEIFKGKWDTYTESLFLELHAPVAAGSEGQAATITLDCGTVINVALVATSECVFVEVVAADGEEFDLSKLDCNCLYKAEFCLVPPQ